MRKAIPVLLVFCGCFGEATPLGDDDAAGSSGGSDEASASGSETSVGTTDGSAGGTSTSAGTSAGTTTSTNGSDSVDDGSDTGVTSCGMLGEECCDDACEVGACHRGRCVAFAGAYAEPMTCGGCTESPNGPNNRVPASMIPYLGACACPSGFDASAGMPTTSDYCPQDGVLHTPTTLRFCGSPTSLEGADWAGAYTTSTTMSCAPDGAEEGCVVANPYTGECSCPAGAAEMVANTWAPCGATSDEPIAIHICVPLAVEPISFGGAFQTRWTGQPAVACESGNPRADDACECPEGFVAEHLRITSPTIDQGGDLALCVRY
jgi:hypothetical protein